MMSLLGVLGLPKVTVSVVKRPFNHPEPNPILHLEDKLGFPALLLLAGL